MTRPVRRLTVVALMAGSTLVPALSGCATSGPSGPTGASLVAASVAPANGAELDAATFAAAIKRPGTVVLDVRTPQEYAAGHLEGARLLDISAADFATRLGALDRKAPYAVYCRSGNRSATALATMRQLGFTTAYHLGEGISAWTAAGLPVVTG